jgi:ABC-type Mn2+/Zn2+ transport system permease subunit
MALTLRKNVLFWDALLFTLIGLTVSMSVLSVGPLATFGFLLLPTLTAHLLARNMWQFVGLAAGLGVVSALGGFGVAYRWDLPVGPTDMALLGLVYGGTFLAKKVVLLYRVRPQRAKEPPGEIRMRRRPDLKASG